MRETLASERDFVKKSFSERLVEGRIWQPIATPWVIKWKQYVDYDKTGEGSTDPQSVLDLHPGKVDNSSLSGSYGDELKRGLVEGADYTLFPDLAARKLFGKYGGGPTFSREVVNRGTIYSPNLQIALYPVRVEAYLCDKQNATPTTNRSDGKHFQVRYFTKNIDLKFALDHVRDRLVGSMSYLPVRWWIKIHEEAEQSEQNPEGIATTSAASSQVDHSQSDVAVKKARVGRLMTCEVTDRIDDWLYLRYVREKQDLRDFIGSSDCVEIIVEAAYCHQPHELDWPRGKLLEKWKDDLRTGDVVDAMMKGNVWCEALIRQVDSDGNITVHFKGWGDDCDEVLTGDEKVKRIKPLNTETPDRSLWDEEQAVDIKVSDAGQNSVWITGKIWNIDKAADRVQVVYSKVAKAKALQNVGGDDDGSKQEKGMDVSDSNGTTSSQSSPSKATAEPEDDSDDKREWFDLFGEEIGPLYSHTNKPKKNLSLLSGARSAVSNVFTRPIADRYDYGEKHIRGVPPVAGAVGLQNLGNTCFMNSILQCLSNTQALTEMFTSGSYKEQINYDNPLGHSGKLAMVYAKLVKDMWNNAYVKIIPREFKQTIGEFQPQFAGYEQQDAQEFMGFLLDGLHEDLNRIKKKVHVKKIESKGRDDNLISSESWKRFLRRNDSLLVEKCYGQLKSHVTCTTCGTESVKFDEFNSVSLPIPIKNTKIITAVVQLLPLGSTPIKVDIEVDVTDTMAQLNKILIDMLLENNLITVLSPLEQEEIDSPVDGSVNGSSNSLQLSEESYEVVNANDIGINEAKDDYELVDEKEGTAAVPLSSVTDSPVSLERLLIDSNSLNPQQKKVIYDRIHFHYGLFYNHRPAILSKVLADEEANRINAQAFGGRIDNLFVCQMENKVPVFPRALYSYSTQKKDQENRTTYEAVDLAIAYRMKTTYSGERVELVGNPMRFSVKKSSTNNEIHDIVKTIMKRFIKNTVSNNTDAVDSGAVDADPIDKKSEDIKDDNNEMKQDEIVDEKEDSRKDKALSLPYELKIMNRMSLLLKEEVAIDDKPFTITSDEILSVVWKTYLKTDPSFDVNALEEVQKFEDLIKKSNDMKTEKSDEKIDENEEESADKKKKMTIYKCFDKFIEREQLADTETVYCSKCKEHLAPLKKMDLWAAPDILILHLKRFQYIPGQYFVHREKIDEFVDFPIENLNLTKYIAGPIDSDRPPIYDLYAVSNHMGGLGGGHYTASCKNFIDNKWYYFNDSSVSPIEPERAVISSAYVLFYKRRSGSLKWAGIPTNTEDIVDDSDSD